MIVVVIIGVLAAIAIPNMIAMQNRAKEGALKSNMHTVQLASEDYSVQNDGKYALIADDVMALVPGATTTFENTFSRLVGAGAAWEDRASFSAPPSAISGITSYADSAAAQYTIKGYGASMILSLVLTPGQ
jgi:type II secretory pathway pseudopilin PulG